MSIPSTVCFDELRCDLYHDTSAFCKTLKKDDRILIDPPSLVTSINADIDIYHGNSVMKCGSIRGTLLGRKVGEVRYHDDEARGSRIWSNYGRQSN